MKYYRVPVVLTKDPNGKSKATIAPFYGNGEIGGKPGSLVFTISAPNLAVAYQKLCAIVRPDDNRPIRGRHMISFFRQPAEPIGLHGATEETFPLRVAE